MLFCQLQLYTWVSMFWEHKCRDISSKIKLPEVFGKPIASLLLFLSHTCRWAHVMPSVEFECVRTWACGALSTELSLLRKVVFWMKKIWHAVGISLSKEWIPENFIWWFSYMIKFITDNKLSLFESFTEVARLYQVWNNESFIFRSEECVCHQNSLQDHWSNMPWTAYAGILSRFLL